MDSIMFFIGGLVAKSIIIVPVTLIALFLIKPKTEGAFASIIIAICFILELLMAISAND